VLQIDLAQDRDTWTETNFGLHKMLEHSGLAEQLKTCEEGPNPLQISLKQSTTSEYWGGVEWS
jgi:hypothetical protein